MPRRSSALLAVLLVLVLVPVTACGDDDPSPSARSDDGTSLTADADVWDDGTADCPLTGTAASDADGATAADEGIDGVLQFGTLSQDHVDGCVEYDVSPPVGGAHNPVWANCGFYDSLVPSEHAVHDLEHGAVWIAYGPDLDANAISTIRLATSKSTHIIASPYPGLGSTVVLSAWSRQLTLDSVTDPRFQRFLDTYVQGPQTPELGAACDGAMGEPD